MHFILTALLSNFILSHQKVDIKSVSESSGHLRTFLFTGFFQDTGLPLKWENEIPWFFDQFSNFLTFLVNFQISWFFPGFQVAWQSWSMDLPLWNTEHIVAITLKHNRSRKFYAIGNHIPLFSAFLATFLITAFLKNSRRKIRVFRSP